MQKSYGGRNRAEAILRIFTEGVKEYAKETGAPLGQALSELAQANQGLWEEYCSDVVPVQGTPSGEGASSRLAAEMNVYAKEHQCSLSVALCEVTKANPDLFREWSEGITTVV
ncbi:MAG: hypothetical protein WCD04_14470 [Terriglobia bacterium]|jgi:hypothetical protein